MRPQLPFIDQLTNPDNLYWSWNKAKNQYRKEGIWYDEIELAAFEANLENNLKSIASDFKNNSYKITPIRPLPFPKKKKDKDHEVRQYFWISVRDQVAWIAFINIIGPNLDSVMPSWSYGNRLYRPVWLEEENGKKAKRIGWYRHTSGNIYRKFRHSWALFQRHVFLTIKAMSRQKVFVDPENEETEELEKTLLPNLQLPYLKNNFWPHRFNKLYWASLDFSKFYPNIEHKPILANIKQYLINFDTELPEIILLAQQLLRFPIDSNEYNQKELEKLNLNNIKLLSVGVPTGLFVAHFLANIAMLDVDKQIEKHVIKNRTVAHFRYVDDHIILAPSFEKLINWIDQYRILLKQSNVGAEFNPDKLSPEGFREYYKKILDNNNDNKASRVKAEEDTLLDPKFPKPLMTETIAQVSNIARTNFELLDEEEQKHLLNELEHLMLADFHDDEMREDTRLSFAATKISKLTPRVIEISRIRNVLEQEIREYKREIVLFEKRGKRKNKYAIEKKMGILSQLEHRLKELNSSIEKGHKNYSERILPLLLEVIHKYPDKLRLWHIALEYCRAIGIESIKSIEDEIKTYLKQKPMICSSLTCSYLNAFIKQILARQIIECAKTITDKNNLYQKCVASINYLNAVMKFLSRQSKYPRVQSKYYEVLSDDLLRYAIGTAELIITSAEIEERCASEVRIILNNFSISQFKKVDWHKPYLSQHEKSIHTLSSWAWWAESLTNNIWESFPGPVWKTVSGILSIKEDTTWRFWDRYPKYLSVKIFKRMASKKDKFIKYINNENLGWLYDATYNKKRNASKLKSMNINFPSSDRTYITLYDWVNFTKELQILKPHDPRVSEWMCLLIIEACINKLRMPPRLFMGQIKKPNYLLIHPANFLISAELKSIDSGSWNDWKTYIKKNPLNNDSDKVIDTINIVDIEDRIGDMRITPYWKEYKRHIDLELIPVRGMAMLLLGLLRRSFDWPNIWNPKGLHRAYDSITRKLILDITCSSRTRGILEACLLWRPKENFDLQMGLFFQSMPPDPEDTLSVLPEIHYLDDFLACVKAAKEVLENYQMSVHGNMPRQLIPVRLEPFKEERDFRIVDA